jgi:hypothetical protein
MSQSKNDLARPSQEPPDPRFRWFIMAALSLALACGLCEALASLLLGTRQGILSWKTGNSVKVLIAAPAVYLLVFLPAAILFALLDRALKQRWADVAMIFSFISLLGISSPLYVPGFPPALLCCWGWGWHRWPSGSTPPIAPGGALPW